MRNLSLSFHSKPVAEIHFSDSWHADKLVHYDSLTVSDLNKDFYENFYASSNNPLRKTREIQFSQILRILNDRFKDSKPRALLDIGCGKGDFVEFTSRNSKCQIEAYGIEPSISQETDRVKKLGLEQIQSSTQIPNQFDIITMLDVFEHFEDPEFCLDRLQVLLKPEGLLILKVPNKDSLLYRIGKLTRFIFPLISTRLFSRLYQVGYPPPHFYYYNAKSLSRLLSCRYDVAHLSYQSEMPIRGLATRFWGVKGLAKLLAITFGLFYWFFSPFSLGDSLLIIAKKKS